MIQSDMIHSTKHSASSRCVTPVQYMVTGRVACIYLPRHGHENDHLVKPQVAKSRVLVLQLSAHAPAFTVDQTAFNGRPGLRPTRCQCALVRVIAAAHLLYANRISTHDDGSCGVRALAELIL